MIFTETIWNELAQLFDLPGYAGYKPDVVEAPNGDSKPCPTCGRDGWAYPLESRAISGRYCQTCQGAGRIPNIDAGKRYLHVALKYNPPAWAERHLARAHWEACKVATALGVPAEFYPRPEDGTLRVLEYPAGAGSAGHTDFDLFTILCWRSTPGDLELAGRVGTSEDWLSYLPEDRAMSATMIDPHLHIGELGALVGLGPATPHRVPARPYVQKSIVYFAMPALRARLPGLLHFPAFSRGPTVAEWLKERKARSRYT